MASVLHLAVGMAAGRYYADRTERPAAWPSMVAFAALSHAPDLDVWAFRLGIPYEAPWGHRGAAHSLLLAVVVGLLLGAITRLGKNGPFLLTALFAAFVAASHGVLDGMTDGGEGVAFFWPFDTTRYFLPWRPLPVAPLGFGVFSVRAAGVFLGEAVLGLPLFWYALERRRPRRAASVRPSRIA